MEAGYSQDIANLSLRSGSKGGSPDKKSRTFTSTGSPSKSSGKKSPAKSPNKISWLRATDEELLDRIKSLPHEPSAEGDKCGDCVASITQLMQEKLQTLLERKIAFKKEKRDLDDTLRALNDENTRSKSDVFATERQADKLQAANARLREEVAKLAGKIQEVDEQIRSVGVHGSKISSEESARLRSGESYFQQLREVLDANSNKEKSALQQAEEEERNLEETLKARDAELQALRAKVEDMYSKESNRQYSFKSVSDTIGGVKSGSKFLK